MTHQNHQTNGASLEDCHTNFFALTDLCGIKWRKFVNGERPNASSDPLDDPILRSYSRCMQADILCVWRRVQCTKPDTSDPNGLSFDISSSKVHPPLSLAAAKELWIFWYGEEPDLSELVDAELLKVAANQTLWNGTWERGLTYECRSLLFKALHNLMERFVLTKDIVRFGKWFVQPCTSSERLFGRSSQHLSFSFTFFVHGDTVCASIDLREHPAVRPLTKEHLAEAAAAFAAVATAANNPTTTQSQHDASNHATPSPASPAAAHVSGGDEVTRDIVHSGNTVPKPRKVILAPFGMAATLTGNSYKPSDPMAEKILEDWASFFPLCNKENSDVPPVVEVVSGGHKMYHPSTYVLVTDLDDMEEMEAAAAQRCSGHGTSSSTSSAEAAALASLSTATSEHAALQSNQKVALGAGSADIKPNITNIILAPQQQQAQQQQQSQSQSQQHQQQKQVQPHYDTLSSSSNFTCTTTNTHAPPPAATEMPERAWQDCIMNTLHVTAAYTLTTTSSSNNNSNSSSTMTSTIQTQQQHIGGGDDSSSGGLLLQPDNQNSNSNSSSSNNINSGAISAIDCKQRVQQQILQMEQQQQQKQLWGFVDPTQKAPCICAKNKQNGKSKTFRYQFSNKKSSHATSHHHHQYHHQQHHHPTTATMAALSISAGTSSSMALLSPPLILASSPSTSSSSLRVSGALPNTNTIAKSSAYNNNSILIAGTTMLQQQYYQQQQQYHHHHQQYHHYHQHQYQHHNRPATPSSPSPNRIDGGGGSHHKWSSRSQRVAFHKRQHSSERPMSNSCSSSATTAKPTSTANTTTTTIPTTTDTIPKPRITTEITPHGGASTYSRNSIGDSMPVPSVGSPGTPAPSPHLNSTLSQPTSVPSAEQLLALSPRAPTSVSNLQQPTTPLDQLLEKNTPAPTPTDQHDNKSITASPYVHAAPPSVEAPASGEGMLLSTGIGSAGPGSVPQPLSVGRCTPTPQATVATINTATGSVGALTQSLQCGTITVKKFEALTPLSGGIGVVSSAIKVEPGTLPNNCPRNDTVGEATARQTISSAAAAEAMSDYLKLYKPPELNVKDIDSFANDDCLKLEVLYDFTVHDAWENHPMKRFKPNEPIAALKPRRVVRTKNLYEGHTHWKPLMPSPGSVYNSQMLSLQAVAACNNSLDANDGIGVGGVGLISIAAKFDMDTAGGGVVDADSSNAPSIDIFPELVDVKTEVLSANASPCKEPKSGRELYTAEGLNPSLNDLEQLFETSSNDESGSVQIHTPPDSNNPSNGMNTTTIDDLKRSTAVASVVAAAAADGNAVGAAAIAALQNCTAIATGNNNNNNSNNNASNNTTINSNVANNGNNCNSGGGANAIQAEDLTKMFPTPPSHEQHHPNSSPCQIDIQMTDLSITTTATFTNTTTLETALGIVGVGTGGGGAGAGGIIKMKQEYSVELGSPVEEPIEDWSYVYRPPQQAKFVGSSKYAPLTNLPSQMLPPLTVPTYKPSWTTKSTTRVAAAQVAAQQQQLQQHQQQLQQQQQPPLTPHMTARTPTPHHHQQLHELLSAGPRTPLQQPRTPLQQPSPMHPNSVPTPLNSGGSNLLLTQLNCPQAALTNVPGGGGGAAATMQQLMQRVAGMSPISPAPASVPFPRGSPMLQPQRQTPIHPPPPYELAVASPATSTSSYLNKQFNSQEPPHTPQSVGMPTHHMGGPLSVSQPAHIVNNTLGCASNALSASSAATRELPEVSSLIVNILLYDTALNVFRDHNFDSSTVCVCNADSQKVGNIRGADSGVYVPLPGNSFNPTPAASVTNAIAQHAANNNSNNNNNNNNGNNNNNNGAIGTSCLSMALACGGSNARMLSAFGMGGGLGSPASLPGAGSGHHTGGSNSSSSTTTPGGTAGSTNNSSNQHINGYVDDDPVDCTCGFSAVVNRRLAYRAGLFYEDEMEITGIAEDPARHKKLSLVALISSLTNATLTSHPANNNSTIKTNNALVPANSNIHTEKSLELAKQQAHAIFDLLLEQCSIIQTSSSSIHRALQRHRRQLARESRQPQSIAAIANVLEYVDANDIMCLALEQARLAFDAHRLEMNEFAHQHQLSPFHTGLSATTLAGRHGKALLSPLLGGGSSIGGFGASGQRLSVHKWPYIPVGYTRSNKDIVRTMNAIQPMLQNAFHAKSRSTVGSKDATYTVSGPLTWRQFHRLAGRASGQCEPQPIPSVIVGHDKDWISVAPLAIHYWDKFLLEPYSYARDVAYLIVCPDNDYVLAKTRSYFKELSSTYEMCKLGRHTPVRGWDGLLAVGARPPVESGASAATLLDEWLRTLADVQLAEKLRVYAYAFQHQLAPYLSRIPSDKTLLQPPENAAGAAGVERNRERTGSPLTNASASLSAALHGGIEVDGKSLLSSPPKLDQNDTSTDGSNSASIGVPTVDSKPDIKPDIKPTLPLNDPLGVGDTPMEDINPPAIVLYVVEPFTFGCDAPDLERLACIALLRCYAELLKALPDTVRSNINIQIISLESILELGRTRNRKRFSDEIKCLALNIFSQCRRHLVHAQTVKSLTGFGTAANMEVFLKSKDEKNRTPYKLYTPPYILAPVHEKNDGGRSDFSRQTGGGGGVGSSTAANSMMRGLNEQKYSVLYCNYCMSEDQSWLLATATDDRGELLEKVCINIDVPNRLRRRKAPARRIGLKKLMDFIMGLISQTAQTWRLVIGRIGRIGHSELKSWSYLLSKPNLQKASKQLRDICKQCTLMYPPSILSACLVTLEPDAKLRVMPDQFTPDERFSQISMQNPLSTPQDVTCTHILVFPTSAVCLSFTRQFQNEPQVDLENDFLNFGEDENEAFADDEFNMGDLLEWEHGPLSNHGSPDRMEDNRSWQSPGGNNFNSAQQQDVEEVGSINQQPLAVGYMVSTAPTGRMPSWFWAACPHLEDVCPVFLKTALHLHVPNIQTTDDILNSTTAHSSANDHPLDSSLTADVLRHVLEGYNALSWLALDSNTHDRLSCLPINVQTLMDLYYLTAAIA